MGTPLDLHVLSTPPAFILSQDQTLNKMVSKEPRFFKSSYRSLIHSFKEIKSRAFFQASLVRRTSRPFWCFVFLSRCLIYKVHAPFSRSADVLFILALPDSVVKNFFQVFRGFLAPIPWFQLFSNRPKSLGSNLISLPHTLMFVKHFLSWQKRKWAGQRTDLQRSPSFVLALPIFPVRLQTSIFGAGELNFRVLDGNGWTLTAINTNLLSFEKESKQRKLQLNFSLLTVFLNSCV